MQKEKVDRERRGALVRGASLLGLGVGGTMLSPLVAGCEDKTAPSPTGTNGAASRYLGYRDRLDKCFTAVLQDVMDAMNVRKQCMDPKVKPLLPGMKCWGEARTIYLETVNEIPEKPFQAEMELLDDTKEGQIIVAQCNARELSAFWGGLLTNAAVGHRAHGVVMDGGARDYHEIVELGFPTFCAGLSPYDSMGRMDGKDCDIPIECGGVKVNTGDLVFGDVDGVVVVPQEMAEEVIEKAWEKVRGESKVREELRSGASVVKTFEKYGIL